VVNIHAREITENLASLVKQIDALVNNPAKPKDGCHAFVVYITDDPDAAEEKLSAVAQKQGLKNTPLTVFDGASGPRGYKISADAEVTVMMWKEDTTVAVNHAFGKGELTEEAVKKVVADAKEHLQ
jgi:hypothetical protein